MHASTTSWLVVASMLGASLGSAACRTPPRLEPADAEARPDASGAPVAVASSASSAPSVPASAAAPWERPSDKDLAVTASAARVPELDARLQELAAPLRTPRAVARMLRALATLDASRGARRACELLRQPELSAAVMNELAPRDRADREDLAASALASVAHGPPSEPPCEGVERWLGDELCPPWFRCGPKGPLTGRETSRQDEPLCTAADLSKAVRAELGREFVEGEEPPTVHPELFALAEVSRRRAVPEKLGAAHARRRYTLSQPKSPACDRSLDVGTPCHCDEATVRDHVCRLQEDGVAQVGLCRFRVDDAKKTIGGMSLALP